ncbi:MAG: hypothetical protein MJ133_01785 [Lachnospiraceae bacterium]|nr:hypothetical protein [Lachnospiraceae bacterium]
MGRRKLSELNVIDDFMMNELATNEELKGPCFRRILSVLLDRDIGEINVKAQSIIQGLETDLKGIRLDVEIKETVEPVKQVANIYDIEPHTKKEAGILKENRYKQARIDSKQAKRGWKTKDFVNMNSLYVIMITNFDMFGEGLFEYTVKNKILERPDIEYDDGLIFKYFNTKGTIGVNEGVRNLLRFIENSVPENIVDEATKEISEYVDKVKKSPETEEAYMTMGDKIDRLCEESEQRGIKIGEQRGIETGRQETIGYIRKAMENAGIAKEFEKVMCEYQKIKQ